MQTQLQFSFFFGWLLFLAPLLQAQGANVQTAKLPHTAQQARRLVGKRSQDVVRALATMNMTALARYIHPKKGVAFYPYPAADKPQKRTSWQLRRYFHDRKIYLWGSYDGTGDPIRLSNKDYFRKFIYDDNFSQSKEINFSMIKPRGNTLNLLPQKYPNAIFVEFYRPARSSQGYDWKGLWLVWQKLGLQWYLIAIAHDEWTI